MLHKIKNHKITRHTARVLSIKLKILLFIILPFVIITLLTSQTNLISGYKSFIVVSGSMEPHIPVGSIVYTKSEKAYAKGDIISFRNTKDQTVTHRIAGVSEKDNLKSFTTKGDANNTADKEPVPAGSVVGKVVFQIPYVGRFLSFIKTPIGFGLIVILPTFLFIISELWTIKREIEKEVEKRVLARIATKSE